MSLPILEAWIEVVTDEATMIKKGVSLPILEAWIEVRIANKHDNRVDVASYTGSVD